jgi:signal transduction histidine kinase
LNDEMNEATGGKSRTLRYALIINVAVCIAYFFGGKLGLELHGLKTGAPLVWLPTGIAVAALFRFGNAVLPGIVIGAIAVVVQQLPSSFSVQIVAGLTLQIAAGPVQAFTAVIVLKHFAGADGLLRSFKSLSIFVIGGSFFSTAISAAMGASAFVMQGIIPPSIMFPVWFNWWIADALGVLVAAPVLLMLEGRWRRLIIAPKMAMELLAICIAVIVLATMLFSSVVSLSPFQASALTYFTFPFLIVASIRGGHLFTTVVTVQVTFITVIGTANGFGPFALQAEYANAYLNLFLIVSALTGLSLSTAVSERNVRETDLRQKRSELNRLYRASVMGEIGSGIAHEINQPLSVISIHTQMLLKRFGARDDDDEERVWLQEIDAGTKKVSGIIERVRNFVQKKQTDLVQFEINDEIRSAVQIVGTQMSLQNLVVDVQLAQAPLITTGDRIEFQLLIVNLLQNAVDAYRDFEATNKVIEITSKLKEKDKLEICVRDYGKGVDEDVAEHIFDSFRTTKSGGTGLGLSICRSVVEQMGGQISLMPKSGDGGGSAFVAQLPVTAA